MVRWPKILGLALLPGGLLFARADAGAARGDLLDGGYPVQ